MMLRSYFAVVHEPGFKFLFNAQYLVRSHICNVLSGNAADAPGARGPPFACLQKEVDGMKVCDVSVWANLCGLCNM